MIESEYLTNHFLIAMPSLADPSFSRTVTYICEHNSDGAMGLVVNRPLNLSLGTVLQQVQLEPSNPQIALQPIYLGGPIRRERLFVIHQQDWSGELTLPINDTLAITASRDILIAIAQGDFPGQTLITLGYAGWGKGQLEEEMAANSWLSVEADQRVIFDTPDEQRWQIAAASLGVDMSCLSTQVGHA